MMLRALAFFIAALGFAAAGGALAGTPPQRPGAMPRYSHIFVIVEENKDYGRIVGSPDAPEITRLARLYGNATNFFAETHPSEPNYVAMVGGYTYGIRDDDAYYCKPHDARPSCPHSGEPGYVDHTVHAPSLATQLENAHFTWKNYNESLPAPGSLAVIATDSHAAGIPPNVYVYASKHSGFINFASVQKDPKRATHIVGFGQLHEDLRTGKVPNFSLVVPNLCDEMHGSSESGTPQDCRYSDASKLISRGDANVRSLVDEITKSPVWHSRENAAIVITFDEDDGGGKQGCCGTDPSDPANAGGGHIATVVVTNHGPRGVVDATPYSHYSLLRTIEDAFGIASHLARANAPGVRAMLPLFAVSPRSR
jgi:hypothetical protein